MANMADIIRVFKLPDWYIPSVNEILRLARYIDTERSDNESRWARYLDCSAFCDENDCFFCSGVQPVFTACGENKTAVARRD